MEQLLEDEILEKLNKLQGLSNAKKTILQYAKYIKLYKTGAIKDIGNANIIINCQENYIDRKALINLLLEILDTNDGYYLTKRELINDVWFNRITNDVVILDAIELQSTLQFNIADLKHRVSKCKDKIFIVISCDYERNGLAYIADNFSWYIETTESSVEDKQAYIINKLYENNIKVAKNCKFVSDLASEEIPVIDTTLINIIIECKSRNTNIINDAFLRKYNQNINIIYMQNEIKKVTLRDKSALQQLDDLIGLDSVKRQIHQIINYLKFNKSNRKMPMLHMVFEGPSGSGKNEVARLVGQIFKEEGILSSGQFVEVSRVDLVAPYIGQTAFKTQQVVDNALGGILFIDEAYSLEPKSSKDFGAECISTLIKSMEDNRDNLCVILAGYTEEMEQLLQSNRGFSSRIQFKVQFPDYTTDELYQIFKKMVKDDGYKLSRNIKPVLVDHFEKVRKQNNFGNGRYVRSLFEKLKFEQADRITLVSDNTIDKNTITKADVINVIEYLKADIPTEKVKIGFQI